jgi:hypothetical protein
MAKIKTKADEYKDIFIKLHKLQRTKGCDNLILLLTRYLKMKGDYMTNYISIVADRTGVCPTGYITTTNRDIMKPVVKEIITIETGIEPLDKDIDKGWDAFIEDYRSHRIKY